MGKIINNFVFNTYLLQALLNHLKKGNFIFAYTFLEKLLLVLHRAYVITIYTKPHVSLNCGNLLISPSKCHIFYIYDCHSKNILEFLIYSFNIH